MVSASISGVSDFFTSIDSMMSDEITSSATARTSLSGEGRRTPLSEVALRLGARPRTDTKRPSPWSFSTLMPGRRRRLSATFWSGNWPIASRLSTSETTSFSRLRDSALARLAAWPITRISESLPMPDRRRLALTSPVAGTSIAWLTGSAPT